MGKVTIAIDVDGVLRDLSDQILKYIEADFPEVYEEVAKNIDKVFYSLDPHFRTNEELVAWMYEGRVFELFGMAGRINRNVIDKLNFFTEVAEENGYEVWIASVQKGRSISATMNWLSKWGCRVKNYKFFDTMQDKIDHGFDVYLDDCPMVVEQILELEKNNPLYVNPDGADIVVPRAIKVPYEFNSHVECPSLDIRGGNFDDLYGLLNLEKKL